MRTTHLKNLDTILQQKKSQTYFGVYDGIYTMKLIIFITFMIAITISCLNPIAIEASVTPPPLRPVQYVDMSRYVGLWYEVAHYPNKYQEGCQDSMVRFSLRDNGEIDVLNSCRDKHEGVLHHADGLGWIVDTSSNARLKVSYYWPFRKEYVIIDQGKEYEYSVICTVDRKNVWIIARTPVISSDVFERIALNIEKQGFHRDNLIKTEHINNLQPDQVGTR